MPQLSPLVRVTVTNLWQLSLSQMVSADQANKDTCKAVPVSADTIC